MGARTDAARAQAVASRSELAAELDRLEAAGRAAVDIPAKVRRAPARTAAAAGGAAFLLAGGPQRLFRRARRAIRGPKADLPPSLLPKDVDKAVRKLGSDGDKVRGTLEREFAKYLEEHEEERKRRDPAAVTASLASSLLAPLVKRAGRQLAEQVLSPEGGGFEEALARVRGRRTGSTDSAAGRTPPAGTVEHGRSAADTSRPPNSSR